MPKKLTGVLNLSRIPKNLIRKNKKGESIIYVDVMKRRSTDSYGNVANITMYDKENKKAIYLADLKEEEAFRGSNSHSEQYSDDLPF